ncbi:hypothetical protein BDQ17DRAFT_1329988 [Cyathus striatus]|nr:hypothetical protein BDQ17DRAFT_1329988 [Cyathus striatus]
MHTIAVFAIGAQSAPPTSGAVIANGRAVHTRDGRAYCTNAMDFLPTSLLVASHQSLQMRSGFHLFELYSSDVDTLSYIGVIENQARTPLSGFTDRNTFHQVELTTGTKRKDRFFTLLYFGEVGVKDVS